MAINKTPNGTYRVRKKYPKDIVKLLKLKNPYFDKIFKTLKEAKNAELEFDDMVQETRRTLEINIFELGGDMLFSDFYIEKWLNSYINGSVGASKKPPSQPTVKNTKDLFRLHILPLFGSYTLNYLNRNVDFVEAEMIQKANEYANFKTLKSYVNQVFKHAKKLKYIRHNNIFEILEDITDSKKIALQNKKEDNEDDLYLKKEELAFWLEAIEEDFKNGDLTELEYAMFWTTFLLTCRKSECYALKWKHVDFENDCIYLNRALDKFKTDKKTKGRKKIIINMPRVLKPILVSWKTKQFEELKQLNIQQTPNQYLFTSCDRKGNINVCVHTDFLNYRINKVKKRHPELTHTTPHMFRHTSTTLASKEGMSLEELRKALTHSDIKTTKIYQHNSDVVPQTPADFIYKSLDKK